MNEVSKPQTGASDMPPLTRFQRVAVAVASAAVSLIVAIDLTIANVSVPSIAAGLGASPREGTWVITSYAVADAITVLLSGWLANRFGTVRTLIAAMTWFVTSSIMCGFATSLDMLVAFRVLQGLSGGPLIPLSQVSLLTIFPRDKAHNAMALWTVTTMLGPITGPIIGGYICDNFSWPLIFLINVPVCLLATLGLLPMMRRQDKPAERRPIDLIGMVLMAIAVASLQFMLDRGHELDWFSSPVIVGLCVVSAIAFVSFIIWELTERHPFINLRVFSNRGFTIAMLTYTLLMGSLFGSIIISPLWMQTNMLYTATWAGIASAPASAAMIFVAPAAAWLTSRFDPRIFICAGLLVIANTYLWRSHFNTSGTLQLIVATQVLIGIGASFASPPSMTMALTSVKPAEMANVNALVAFMRTISVAIATSVFVTYWQDSAIRNRVDIVDRVAGASAVQQISIAGLPHDQSVRHLDALVQSQSVMMATNDTYLFFAVLAVVGSAFIWLAPKPLGRGRRR
jgi:DHA2 family multidrug resistance protein